MGTVTNIISISLACVFSMWLMFFWENRVRWWLRLPFINIALFLILLVTGFIEEIYLTFHPNERTKLIRTSISQKFF